MNTEKIGSYCTFYEHWGHWGILIYFFTIVGSELFVYLVSLEVLSSMTYNPVNFLPSDFLRATVMPAALPYHEFKVI